MNAVLIVEDKDPKFEAVRELVNNVQPGVQIQRARTVVDAENLLSKGGWSLVLLDVSMDISGTSQGALGGGHANLGGLDVLDTMYYEALEVATIIITGFDYFIASASGEESEYIGLFELEQQARKKIGDHLRGCLRYGSHNWSARLRELLEGFSW